MGFMHISTIPHNPAKQEAIDIAEMGKSPKQQEAIVPEWLKELDTRT